MGGKWWFENKGENNCLDLIYIVMLYVHWVEDNDLKTTAWREQDLNTTDSIQKKIWLGNQMMLVLIFLVYFSNFFETNDEAQVVLLVWSTNDDLSKFLSSMAFLQIMGESLITDTFEISCFRKMFVILSNIGFSICKIWKRDIRLMNYTKKFWVEIGWIGCAIQQANPKRLPGFFFLLILQFSLIIWN